MNFKIKMRVAINGFGRIGRAIFKIALDNKIDVVAINDIHGPKDAEYLLKYDSIYGRYQRKVNVKGDYLNVNGKKILILSERDLKKINWKKLKVDIVIEATGAFRDKKKIGQHLKSGAKRVIVTAPSKGVDITIVPGVNDKKLKKSHKIISVASCTTNCLAPITKILNDNFGVRHELVTTIHAYTSSQNLVGGSHKKPRRGRAAALNMIPTTTGASIAVEKVLPELKGQIGGLAVRVPVAVVSLIDLVAELKKDFTEAQVKTAFKKASNKEMRGIVGYTDEPLVSSDFIADLRSAVVDFSGVKKEGNLIKVLAWYDNEYAYSARVVDVIKMIENGR